MGTGARGSGGKRFQRMVDAVADEGAGQDALVAALSFCAEDGGRYFPTEVAARALVRRAGGGDGTGATPDMILLSVRAITYLCDAMPCGADAVIRHSLLPVLCSRLLAIEYLDVAEQCLQAFEKISQRQPTQCLQVGMINVVGIDFFTASIQRVAVSAVANACKKVSTDCSQSPGLFWIRSQLSVIFYSPSQDKVSPALGRKDKALNLVASTVRIWPESRLADTLSVLIVRCGSAGMALVSRFLSRGSDVRRGRAAMDPGIWQSGGCRRGQGW